MSSGADHSLPVLPIKHRPRLPMDRLILRDEPDEDAVPLDVLIVGGGPAGLAAAISLARQVQAHPELGELEIGVLEKAETLGGHCLSGAVVNPSSMQRLFPDVSIDDLPLREKVEKDAVYYLTKGGAHRVPAPPTMKNHGNYTASICEIVRWMGEQAEALGIHLMTGYPADALLVDGNAVRGVRTTAMGLGPSGEETDDTVPPTDVTARVTILAEGTRGRLTQAWLEWQGIESTNPQIYALGVKELWQSDVPLDSVIHTLGYPLAGDTFGGSWLYPMGENLISLGLVVGLDAPHRDLDVHMLLQSMKRHPFIRRFIESGTLVEWGAKTIPEGGYASLPRRLSGDGCVLVGDAAGFVDVASLKGIHYAMESGMLAADAVVSALQGETCDASSLAGYDASVKDSVIHRDLHARRNMRLAFKSGRVVGGMKSMLMAMTGGRFPGGQIRVKEDAEEARRPGGGVDPEIDNSLTFSKVDGVYHSDNSTRDDIPSHLDVADTVDEAVGRFYAAMCPAGVYEWQDGALVVNAPNCVDCKATDVLGPRWAPREGGSGPSYKRM